MKRNNEIQSLRAIAMLLILVGHMPIALPGRLLHGYSFVSLFLAISGYFAALQFKRKYDGKGLSGAVIAKREILNKFFRLFPLMYIWIAIYFVTGWIITALGGQYGDMGRWLAEIKASLLLTYNYYLAGLDIGGLFGQYWTLFVEIHFFAIFLIAFILLKKHNSRIVFSAAMVVLTVFVLRPLTPVKLIRYATLAQLDSLFCGVLLGLCCDPDKKYLQSLRIPGFVKCVIGLVLIALTLLSGYHFDVHYNDPNVKYFVYTTLCTVILFLARENDGWFRYGKVIDAVLKWCGDASASTYVSHVLLYSCIYYNVYTYTSWIPETIKVTSWGIILQVVGLLVGACLVGRISYLVIEKPFAALSRKVLAKLDPPVH